ncbi:MAG: hypothetical protein HY574_01485 [candidate division NC10 bacterium]|nr:hypothetical protein [candidate division NC10 bacterium]
MSWDDDYHRYQEEAAMEAFREEELRRIAEEPVFGYLAVHGDAIEARVKRCLAEAQVLSGSGHHGAALTRAASGVEVTIRFFLARPLVQGAFLSEDWAELLSQKVLSGRTAEDRELLPAILWNWRIDITKVKLPDGSQAWEQIVRRVWPRRNDYVHKADDASADEALLAIECLTALLSQVVDPLATRLGFTREQTGCWSVVAAKNPPEHLNLNPPRTHPRRDPFLV